MRICARPHQIMSRRTHVMGCGHHGADAVRARSFLTPWLLTFMTWANVDSDSLMFLMARQFPLPSTAPRQEIPSAMGKIATTVSFTRMRMPLQFALTRHAHSWNLRGHQSPPLARLERGTLKAATQQAPQWGLGLIGCAVLSNHLPASGHASCRSHGGSGARGHAWACVGMRGHAWACEGMRGHARVCEGMRGHARACEGMRGHVTPDWLLPGKRSCAVFQ